MGTTAVAAVRRATTPNAQVVVTLMTRAVRTRAIRRRHRIAPIMDSTPKEPRRAITRNARAVAVLTQRAVQRVVIHRRSVCKMNLPVPAQAPAAASIQAVTIRNVPADAITIATVVQAAATALLPVLRRLPMATHLA